MGFMFTDYNNTFLYSILQSVKINIEIFLLNRNKEMDALMDVLSLSAICKRDDEEPDNWWFCTKCNRKLIYGEYHKKYCNSTKEKHKHKLTKDHTKQFVKDGRCFRCGRKDHYILDCTYPKI